MVSVVRYIPLNVLSSEMVFMTGICTSHKTSLPNWNI